MAFRLGLLPRRWVTLEVRGRRTGTVTRFPLGMADVRGHWYVVSVEAFETIASNYPVFRVVPL